MAHLRLAVSLCFVVASSFVAAQTELPDYIGRPQRDALSAWLSKNPQYRLATDEDCGCQDDLARVRNGTDEVWKPNPGFHPYYVSGDFNGDKRTDFAAILVNRKNQKRILVIFNGPYVPRAKPAYIGPAIDVALFFGPPRPKPYRLLVGPFASEGYLLMPKGGTYERGGGDDEE